MMPTTTQPSRGNIPLAKVATVYTQVLELPHPNPPLVKGRELDFLVSPLSKATVYTQVIESLPVLELPHPNPPLVKGSHCVAGVEEFVASGVRELDFLVSPLYKGGLRGVKPGSQSNSDLCVHRSLSKGSHCVAEVTSVVASGGGLRGVKPGSQSNSDLCIHRRAKVEGILASVFCLLSSAFCFLPFAFVASAHNVKTTADVGGTLHIQPSDNPRAGEPSQVWIALTRKGGKVIPLKECNCQLAVYAEPHSPKEPALLEPPLQAITAERYQGIPGSEITFPKPGAYLLELSGKPASGESFQPFKLKFEVTVAVGTTPAIETQNTQNINDTVEDKKSGFSLPIAIALSCVAAGSIIFVVLQRRR